MEKDKSGRYLFTFMLAAAWAFSSHDVSSVGDFFIGLLKSFVWFAVINIVLYYLIDR